MIEQQLFWLDDHPDKTAVDFLRVSMCPANEREGAEFEAWLTVYECIAEGSVRRLGGGNFQKIGPVRSPRGAS